MDVRFRAWRFSKDLRHLHEGVLITLLLLLLFVLFFVSFILYFIEGPGGELAYIVQMFRQVNLQETLADGETAHSSELATR